MTAESVHQQSLTTDTPDHTSSITSGSLTSRLPRHHTHSSSVYLCKYNQRCSNKPTKQYYVYCSNLCVYVTQQEATTVGGECDLSSLYCHVSPAVLIIHLPRNYSHPPMLCCRTVQWGPWRVWCAPRWHECLGDSVFTWWTVLAERVLALPL